METPLSEQMIARANKDNLPDDHPMRTLALKFDELAVSYVKGNVTVASFMGAWTRARKCWCDYTGEPLV